MSFTSLTFLFIFLPISVILYLVCPGRYRNVFLVIASLLFYSWGEPIYIFLLVAMAVFAFFIARYLDSSTGRVKDESDRKFILVVAVVVSLLGLVFFKYYGFLIDNINTVFRSNLKIKDLPLPLGISFYTFKQLSYIFDVYRGKVKHERNFLDLLLYISIFPQVGAGPIVQYSDMISEIKARKPRIYLFGIGFEKFVIGLGKKVIIANSLALLWADVKAIPGLNMSSMTAWLGIIAFSLQIYFDFSGYSDMAIGLGNMLGFEWQPNFNYPYISNGVRDFWRRWHISLGSWFRDYIYIPLGGNRRGIKIEIRNMFVVWAVTGLWHGASWNFIIWGLYFGVLIFIERMISRSTKFRLPKVVGILITVFLVVISWVIFDMSSVSQIAKFISVMFGVGAKTADSQFFYMLRSNWKLIFIAIIGSTPLVNVVIKNFKYRFGNRGRIGVGVFYFLIVVLSTAMLIGESYSPFLYFKF